MFVQAELNKFSRDKKNYRIGSDKTERIPLGRQRERKKKISKRSSDCRKLFRLLWTSQTIRSLFSSGGTCQDSVKATLQELRASSFYGRDLECHPRSTSSFLLLIFFFLLLFPFFSSNSRGD